MRRSLQYKGLLPELWLTDTEPIRRKVMEPDGNKTPRHIIQLFSFDVRPRNTEYMVKCDGDDCPPEQTVRLSI